MSCYLTARLSSLTDYCRPSAVRVICTAIVAVVGLATPAAAQDGPRLPRALVWRHHVREPVLSFENGWQVSSEEFAQVWQKHLASTHTKPSTAEAKRFLQLYTEFCRKVMEAEQQGLDTTPDFRAEYNTYLSQLAQTFLVEKELVDHLVDEATVRSFYQVHASHLLVALPPNAHPDDTLAAWRRVLSYRDSIVYGRRSFADMAARYSEEPGASTTRGELGYFSVFEMVYPFETAAYLTAPGTVSMPVRTEFGYHLVYVHNRMSNQAGRTVAHIFINTRDSVQGINRLNQLRLRHAAGESFTDLARCCSDDNKSAGYGGVLTGSHLLPEMERMRGDLRVGEVSPPFRTAQGWHILTVLEDASPLTEATRRALYRSRIIRDGRVKRAEAALVEGLKRRSEFKLVPRGPQVIARALGNRYFTLRSLDVTTLDRKLLKQPLFTFADQTVRFVDLLTSRTRNMERPPLGLPLEDVIRRDIERLAHQQILKWEEFRLPNRYPEFRALAREYHDGILLFTLMERNVWRRAMEDTAGLRKYYDDNLEQFTRQPMLQIVQMASHDSLALRTLAADFRYRNTTPQPYAERGNRNNASMQFAANGKAAVGNVADGAQQPQQLQVIERIVPTALMDSAQATRMLTGGPGYCDPVRSDNGQYSCECLRAVLPTQSLQFAQIRGELLRAYQVHLERTWLNTLAKRYPVRVHEKALARILGE